MTSLIKINRARKLSNIGRCPASFDAMLQALPHDIVSALPSRQLAVMIDSNWEMSCASKSIALRDAFREGGAWDATKQRFVEFRRAAAA